MKPSITILGMGRMGSALARAFLKQGYGIRIWNRTKSKCHDIQYLDGAIMATPNLIGAPECTILYSGPAEPFEKYRPVFFALGGNALHVGNDVGHASALDSALLIVMWGALFGAVHGAAICQAEQLPLEAYLGYLKPLLPQVDEWVTDTVQRIADDRLAGDEATLASVDVHYVALRALLELCQDRGIYRAVPDAFGQLFQVAVKVGHAQDDFAILSKFMREQSPEHSAEWRLKA